MLLALLTLLGPAMFSLDAPDAKAVLWAGDVTGWSAPKPMERNGDVWTIVFDLAPDARVEYKFVVDGEWMLDPDNPKRVPNGVGDENSVWEGPDYKRSAPDSVPREPMVRSEFALEGPGVPRRTVVLFVPPGEHKDLPMLVYADGGEYETLAHAPRIVKNLIDAGSIRPLALVLVPPVDRNKEYWRDSAPYSRWLVETLLPEVRKRAPCSPAAKDVFLGGASLGGLVALRTAAEHPLAIAGGIHAQSGAFWVEGQAPVWPVKALAPGIRVFCDWGTFEGSIGKATESLVVALKAQGIKVHTWETPEGHNWSAWRERLAFGLVSLFGTKK